MMGFRRMCLVCACVLAIAVFPAPAFAASYVMDEADVIDASTESRINQLSSELEQATPGAEVAVVTVESLRGQSIERYAEDRFERLGVGSEDRNNGVLILVAPNERKVRIEVGYGLETTLSDSRAERIVDQDILPRFREDDYSGGIERGHEEVVRILADTYDVTLEGLASEETTGSAGGSSATPYLCAGAGLIALVIIGSVLTKGKGLKVTTDSKDSNESSTSTSRGSNRDGFGGGDSGGGGASGSW